MKISLVSLSAKFITSVAKGKLKLLLLFLLLSFYAKSQETYTYVGSIDNDASDYFVNNNVQSDYGEIKVWVKITAQKGKIAQFRKAEIASRRNYKLHAINYQKYAYKMALYHVDCSNKKISCIAYIDYSIDKTVIDNIDGLGIIQSDVVPGSIGAAIQEFACNIYNSNTANNLFR